MPFSFSTRSDGRLFSTEITNRSIVDGASLCLVSLLIGCAQQPELDTPMNVEQDQNTVVEERQPDKQKPPEELKVIDPRLIFANTQERPARSAELRLENGTVRGDGLVIQKDAKAIMSGDKGEEKLAQEPKRFELISESATKTLAMKPSTPAVQQRESNYAVTFPNYFEDVALEYTYDGTKLEEFFHLSNALLSAIQNDRSSIKITSLMPGQTEASGAFLTNESGGPLFSDIHLLGDPETQKTPPPEDTKRISTQEDVLLNLKTGAYVLPRAVAIDGQGRRKTLVRTFEFTAEGLQIEVELDKTWLAKAQAPVVIDPSVIRAYESASLRTWFENSFVRDSQGYYHFVWRMVSGGYWRAVHSMGTPDAQTWTTPHVIDPVFDAGDNRDYTPSIAIGPDDKLHVIWADYGSAASAGATYRGNHIDRRHRYHYAYCANRCTDNNWTFDGLAGGRVIGGSDTGHSRYSHHTVDQNGIVHLAIEQTSGTDPGGIEAPYHTRYFQINGDTVTEQALLPDNSIDGEIYHSNFLLVDSGNRIHYFGADYWNSRRVEHRVWNGSQWDNSDTNSMYIYQPGCTTQEPLHSLNAAEGPDGRIHVATGVRLRYGHSCSGTTYYDDTWSIGYGRLTRSGSSYTWDDTELIYNPTVNSKNHGRYPRISVSQENMVYVAWHRVIDPQQLIQYAYKQSGASFWWGPLPLYSAVGRMIAFHMLPVISTQGITGMRNPSGGLLELVVIESGYKVMYVNTGQPLLGPDLIRPFQASYVATPSVTLQWNPIPTDSNTGEITYHIQIDNSPLFDSPLVDQNLGAVTSYDFSSGTNNGYYYWRVKASNDTINNFGDGPYSQTFEFGLKTDNPGPATPQQPANGSNPTTLEPTFQWSAP